MLAQFEAEIQQRNVGVGQVGLVVIRGDPGKLLFRKAHRAQCFPVQSETVGVPSGGCDQQEDQLFLRGGEGHLTHQQQLG